MTNTPIPSANPIAASQSGIMPALETVFPDSLFGVDMEIILVVGGTLFVVVSLIIIISGVFSKKKKSPRKTNYATADHDDAFSSARPPNISRRPLEMSFSGTGFGTFNNAPPQVAAPIPPHAGFHGEGHSMHNAAPPSYPEARPPTSFSGALSSAHDQSNTQHIGLVPPAANVHGAGFVVKISSLGGTGKTWDLPIRGELLIGRAAHCALLLDDPSAAREQCKIVISGRELAVMNLSGTNITILNGIMVSGTAPLQTGDTLVLGREVLRVDHIHSPTAPPPEQMAPNYGYTESIF